MKKVFLGIDESKNYRIQENFYVYAGVYSLLEEDIKLFLYEDKLRLTNSDLETYFSFKERSFDIIRVKDGAPLGFVEVVPLLIENFLNRNKSEEIVEFEVMVDGNIDGKHSKIIYKKFNDNINIRLVNLNGFNKGMIKYNRERKLCFEYPYILRVADTLAHNFAFGKISVYDKI